ncbi:threonine ammonia-lyase, biosynthetic, partial [Glaesserella parasuis]|nr:threonine ammonia-lyase, biosynthetic [Glaesserella parasuis]
SSIQQEELYSFEFPEQKGALLKFLQTLIDWDISLFHYRAHGADYGDILAAFVVNSSEKEAFKQDLDRLGYRYQDVNDSPAYQYFLR